MVLFFRVLQIGLPKPCSSLTNGAFQSSMSCFAISFIIAKGLMACASIEQQCCGIWHDSAKQRYSIDVHAIRPSAMMHGSFCTCHCFSALCWDMLSSHEAQMQQLITSQTGSIAWILLRPWQGCAYVSGCHTFCMKRLRCSGSQARIHCCWSTRMENPSSGSICAGAR